MSSRLPRSHRCFGVLKAGNTRLWDPQNGAGDTAGAESLAVQAADRGNTAVSQMKPGSVVIDLAAAMLGLVVAPIVPIYRLRALAEEHPRRYRFSREPTPDPNPPMSSVLEVGLLSSRMPSR